MFVGKYYNSIDSKSRVIVPAKFRLELGGRCIVAKALDKCLTVYPFEQWAGFQPAGKTLEASLPFVRRRM